MQQRLDLQFLFDQTLKLFLDLSILLRQSFILLNKVSFDIFSTQLLLFLVLFLPIHLL